MQIKNKNTFVCKIWSHVHAHVVITYTMHALGPSVVSLTCLEQFNGEQREASVLCNSIGLLVKLVFA